MNKRYWGIIILSLIAILFSVYRTVSGQIGDSVRDAALIAAIYGESRAVPELVVLHQSEEYEKAEGKEALQQMGEEMAQKASMPVGEMKQIRGHWVYQTAKELKGGAQASLQIMHLSDLDNRTYVTWKVTHNRFALSEVEKLAEQMNQWVQTAGFVPQFNACIQGRISDRLNNGDWLVQPSSLLEKMLNKREAKVVESFQDDTALSISAYTPEIGKYIWTNQQKMNLQVAAHRDRRDGSLVVTIGTPIITVEY
ncbi:YwmB family TATA-box binding protein [Microaerobacter geothermalis]|uniref:YwmB family TATA-box binding protein n=1 Tax=Microaerobacter geothermalis TaxID=674972 RepID=UPI001F4911B9|nr:YwmB family TATA-box binding protein [Microaerobacter geothermalis]MCF6093241.1 YwmB family TATA-box binding protein [Microaerobacter geothermalis]